MEGTYIYTRGSNAPILIKISKDGRKKNYTVDMKFSSGMVHTEEWTDDDIKELKKEKKIKKA